MFIELTPDQTRLLIKAAELRVVGRSWDQTARLLDYDTEELTELARESGPAYDKILATVDRGSTREARQEANLTLREQAAQRRRQGRPKRGQHHQPHRLRVCAIGTAARQTRTRREATRVGPVQSRTRQKETARRTRRARRGPARSLPAEVEQLPRLVPAHVGRGRWQVVLRVREVRDAGGVGRGPRSRLSQAVLHPQHSAPGRAAAAVLEEAGLQRSGREGVVEGRRGLRRVSLWRRPRVQQRVVSVGLLPQDDGVHQGTGGVGRRESGDRRRGRGRGRHAGAARTETARGWGRRIGNQRHRLL